MISAISSAASGIRQGLAMLDRAAGNIVARQIGQPADGDPTRSGDRGDLRSVAVPGPEGDLVGDIMTTIIAKHTVALNADVLRRADAVAGSLLDILG